MSESTAIAVRKPEPESEERVHHPYSPSTLQSLEACPCYKSRDSQHIRSIIGTIAHKATETRNDDLRLSDDDAAAVAECIDFFERRKQLMIEARSLAGAVPDIIELTESYLPIDDCKFEDGVEGTTAGYVDCGIISWDRTHAELIDYKFGLWPIERAENNLQGIAYSLGLFRKYPTLLTVTFFFKQPLLDSIQEATFNRSDIPALFLRVQTVVAEAREARRLIEQGDWSKARPMVPACNFCANLGRCPAVAKFACSTGSKFFPLEIPENITPTMVHSPEQTVLALRLCQVMATWAKSFRSVLTDRVFRGDAALPEGFKLESRSDREIKDEAKYKAIALEYLTEEEFRDSLTVSFTAVEKKIQDKAERGNKLATVKAFKDKLEDTGAVERGLPYTFLKATANSNKS
jgi:uncharacterized protein DUF2800